MDLDLRFTGLCGFVPDGGMYRVVMVNSEHMAEGHEGARHIRHYPVLFAPSDQVNVDESRMHDIVFDGKAANFTQETTEMYGFILEDEVLEIDGLGGSVTPDPTPRDQYCPSTVQNASSLGWAISMKDFGVGTMSREAFYGTTGLVSAELLLASGMLRTTGLARDKRGRILKWEFRNASGTVGDARAIAEEIQFTAGLAAAEARFRSSRTVIDDPDQNFDIVFQPDKDLVSCWLAHQPLDDITKPSTAPQRVPIDHFELFFHLTKESVDPVIPYPRFEFCPNPVGGASSPRCPVAFFTDHD